MRNDNKIFQGTVFNNLDDAAKLYTALYMDSRELKDRRGHCGLLRERDKVNMCTKTENILFLTIAPISKFLHKIFLLLKLGVSET